MVLNKTRLTSVYYIFMKLTLYCRESALAIPNWTNTSFTELHYRIWLL